MTYDIRPVGREHEARLLEINRACPVVGGFTFLFDRSPSFFAWPDAAFDEYRYFGAFQGDALVGYCLAGRVRGATGGATERFVYGGDLRVLPEARNRGVGRLLTQAGTEAFPFEVGFALVKEGNAAGERTVDASGRLMTRVVHRRLCRFDAANIVPLGRPGPRSFEVRRARPADLEPMAELMSRAHRGRLFAPTCTPESLSSDASRVPGLALERHFLAEKAGRLVGMVCAWDQGPLRRTRVLAYSPLATLLRAAHRVARLAHRDVAPMPSPGESFRGLTLTRLAIDGRDPAVLADLLAAVAREERGYHLLHLGLAGEDPLRHATRGFLTQHFRSQIVMVQRAEGAVPPLPRGAEDPYIDPAIL